MHIKIACLVIVTASLTLTSANAFDTKTLTGFESREDEGNVAQSITNTDEQNAWMGREKRAADSGGDEEAAEPKSWTTRVKDWFARTAHRVFGSGGSAGDRGGDEEGDAEGGTGLVGRFLRWLVTFFTDRLQQKSGEQDGEQDSEQVGEQGGKPMGNEGKRTADEPQGDNNDAPDSTNTENEGNEENVENAAKAEEMESSDSQEVSDWETAGK